MMEKTIMINKKDIHQLLRAITNTKEHVKEDRKEQAIYVLEILEKNLKNHLFENKKETVI